MSGKHISATAPIILNMLIVNNSGACDQCHIDRSHSPKSHPHLEETPHYQHRRAASAT